MDKTHETLEVCHTLGTNAAQEQQRVLELIAELAAEAREDKRAAATVRTEPTYIEALPCRTAIIIPFALGPRGATSAGRF